MEPLGFLAVALNPEVDLLGEVGAVANRGLDLIRPQSKVVGGSFHVAIGRPNRLHHLPDVQAPPLDTRAPTCRPLPKHNPRVALTTNPFVEESSGEGQRVDTPAA